MLHLKIGRGNAVTCWFEIELNPRSLYIRAGSFERYYNGHGLPSH